MHRKHHTDNTLSKNNFAKQVAQKYGKVGVPNVQTQILRVLAPLTTSESYSFDLRRTADNGGKKFLERLMNDQRYYGIREARLAIVKIDAAATASAPGTALKPRTFVDPAIFADADEQVSLCKVYNGDLDFKIENDIIMEKFPTELFLDDMAGTQVGSLTEDKGFIHFEPNYCFKGDEQVTLDLKLGWGTNVNIEGLAADETNYVMIEFLVWEHLGMAGKATSGACPVLNYATS